MVQSPPRLAKSCVLSGDVTEEVVVPFVLPPPLSVVVAVGVSVVVAVVVPFVLPPPLSVVVAVVVSVVVAVVVPFVLPSPLSVVVAVVVAVDVVVVVAVVVAVAVAPPSPPSSVGLDVGGRFENATALSPIWMASRPTLDSGGALTTVSLVTVTRTLPCRVSIVIEEPSTATTVPEMVLRVSWPAGTCIDRGHSLHMFGDMVDTIIGMTSLQGGGHAMEGDVRYVSEERVRGAGAG